MRYFVPDMEITDSIVVSKSYEGLGGLPVGLAAAAWPKCVDCGKSQSLLAQFKHHPDRLDLGREGRTLFVFQCNHDPGMCATWDARSGANACLILEPEELSTALPDQPADRPTIEHATMISKWIARDDGIAESDASAFFSGAAFFQLDQSIVGKVSSLTKLGGLPCWIQSPDERPGADWQFIGQLDSGYSFLTPPRPASWISPDAELFEGRTHWGEGPNFGDGGTAYLFLRPADPKPDVIMFWQCG